MTAMEEYTAAKAALEHSKRELIAAEERLLYVNDWTRHKTLAAHWVSPDGSEIIHRAQAVKKITTNT